MKKQSRKSVKRETARKKSDTITAEASALDMRSVALDFFRNAAARMGHGTPSLAEDTQYVMDRISLNYWLLLTLFRNHWLSRRIVELPAKDMCKSWAKIKGDTEPDDIKRFDRVIAKTLTPSRIEQAIIWGRLFGGAGCLICVKGHEKFLDKPLDLDDVAPGSYLGLIPFDRWVGIVPTGEISTDLTNPIDWGLPKYYEVRDSSSAASFKVHCSRILRFIGPSVPTPELQAQTYWGISVLEPAYEDIRKLDNATWSTLNLMFRAQIMAQRNPELSQLLSGLGSTQQATARWQSAMQAQNELISNQSMMILGKEGELFTTQYSFAGMSDVVSMFIMLSAGAAEIPVTKLFGRTITGLGQSNEADERLYEGTIAHKQASDLRPQLDSKLYPVIAMSTLGEVPDDLEIEFPSVRVMQEEEKSELAEKGSAVIYAGFNSGVYGPKTTLQELQQLSQRTGIFTNITDEMIDKAPEEPQMPGEAMTGMGGPGEGKPGESGEPGEEDWKKFLPKATSPSSALHKEAGGAMDSIAKRTAWHGLDVSIENQAGSVRSGTGPDGKPWEVTMTHDYGYLRKTRGVDGDHVDVFLGPDHKAQYVYVVHTRRAPDFKSFDEDKCFCDFSSADHARLAFLANYDRPEHFGSMDTLSVGDFIDKVLATKERPKSITADALKKKNQDHVIGASFSPVFQDRFGDNGNCFNACLASLLEVELHDIPEFPAHQEPEFDKEVNAWLAGRGLTYKRVKGATFAGQDVYHIIEGISPRGGPHACVGLNGRIIHDPHPAGGGLDKVERWGFLEKKSGDKPSLLRRAVDALSKLFDDWKEEEHPREKGGENGGQFTAGSGGSSTTAKSAHLQSQSRESWPEHIKALKIPPAWTDVKVASDPDADLLAIGMDKAGRKQYVYSEKLAKTQSALKFARIQSLEKDLPMIEGQLGELRKSEDQKTADLADCATLIMKMGIRPGSDDDTKAKVQAYGATTLEGKHVVHEDGEIYLRFTGKKGVPINLRVEDPELAKALYERAQRVGEDGRIFGSVNDAMLRGFVDGKLDHGGYHPKDFRTRLGTTEAQRLVSEMPAPKNEKEYRKAVLAVAKQVSAKLANTPTICLQAYIAPQVFQPWKESYGAS